MKEIKTINLKKRKARMIGYGSFATVYKISPKRVVKVFEVYPLDLSIKLIRDEVKGSKRKDNLPIIDIVNVNRNGQIYPGILKEYLPYRVSQQEVDRMPRYWDKSPRNCRKRTRNGKPLLIDSQTRNALRLAGL